MDEYFEFLEDLRESGEMNVFEAPRVLKEAFDLDKREAVKIFTAWTKQKR